MGICNTEKSPEHRLQGCNTPMRCAFSASSLLSTGQRHGAGGGKRGPIWWQNTLAGPVGGGPRSTLAFQEVVIMSRRTMWHGCQGTLLLLLSVSPVAGDGPIPIRSRAIEIDYAVNEDAFPLDAVHLWYTLDRGNTWLAGLPDEDRQPPATFEAPGEGLYGFFLVLENSTGPSSGPPKRGTEPHLWAFVDYTAPIVQLHPPRQTTVLGQSVLQFHWTAIDAHLGPRPVEIWYRRLPTEDWDRTTSAPLPNTGRYDWRLPVDLNGAIAVRVSVCDLGGHRVESEPQIVELASFASPPPVAEPLGTKAGTRFRGSVQGNRPGSSRAKERAARLFAEALAAGTRGEYRKGIARLREVVRLNPEHAEAFAEMGEMLYRVGDFERALSAYGLALQQQPAMRTALRGAARAYRQKNDLAAAASHLRTVLRHNPNDAEVWVNLGDVAIYQGDDVLARECYTRAAQIDPTATQAIEDARRRLTLMAEVSRTYHPGGQ